MTDDITDLEDNIFDNEDIELRKLERRALSDKLADDAQFRANYEANIKAKADHANSAAPTTAGEFDAELIKRQSELEEAFALADELSKPPTIDAKPASNLKTNKLASTAPINKTASPPKHINLPDDISLDELTKIGQTLEALAHINTINIHHVTINISR